MTAEEFKEARLRKKITQQRLGEMIGFKDRCAEISIQRWEYGTRTIPPKYWRKLSEILDIPLERFVP